MLYCENNHEMEEGSKFCAVCGAPESHQAFALEADQTVAVTTALSREVQVVMDLEPVTHSRLTVIFRIFMVFPLLVLAYFVGIAVQVVTIVSWFSALFTKRIPEGIHQFVAGYLKVQANLAAYTFLVTAKWPSFTLSPTETDQVKVFVAQGDLNRGAVFFRIILGLPALMLNIVLFFGSWVVHFIMWITAIITGHTPRGMHQAAAAIIRFQTRTSAYLFLLTPEQPWHGMFGDRIAEGVAEDSTPDAPWVWALAKSARRWIAVSMLLGALTYVGYITLLVQIVRIAANQNPAATAIYVCDEQTGSFAVSYEPFTCTDNSQAVKQIWELRTP